MKCLIIVSAEKEGDGEAGVGKEPSWRRTCLSLEFLLLGLLQHYFTCLCACICMMYFLCVTSSVGEKHQSRVINITSCELTDHLVLENSFSICSHLDN